ncbi:MAG: hypothetical protein JO015_11195 [Verrucomicrobia bacterium]|nr:hypothetical protein [Verrucomicrobiota bacterium]
MLCQLSYMGVVLFPGGSLRSALQDQPGLASDFEQKDPVQRGSILLVAGQWLL